VILHGILDNLFSYSTCTDQSSVTISYLYILLHAVIDHQNQVDPGSTPMQCHAHAIQSIVDPIRSDPIDHEFGDNICIANKYYMIMCCILKILFCVASVCVCYLEFRRVFFCCCCFFVGSCSRSCLDFSEN
jgi:hypothetical protein